MDIAEAYPAQADVKSWIRNFVFNNRKGSLLLKENYALQSWKEPFVLNFMTPLDVKQNTPGEIILKDKENQVIQLKFDPELFTVLIEDKMLEDPRLTNVWGEKLFRISLLAKQQLVKGEHSIEFKAIN